MFAERSFSLTRLEVGLHIVVGVRGGTKAALLLFSKNVDFTNVLAGIAAAVPEHPNFKRELQKISDTHVRYLFRQRHDPDRDLYLAVQAFNIPKRAKDRPLRNT